MKKSKRFSHFTLEERQIVQQGCYEGKTITLIAKKVGHSKSSTASEIFEHRILKYQCKMPLECSNYKTCKYGRNCSLNCDNYIEFYCKRRDKSPKCCNGCSNYQSCRMSKYYYEASVAEKEANELLKSSRSGINQEKEDIAKKALIIVPLIKQGQSPYVIVSNHPELGMSEKTLYNYIELGAFKEHGLLDIDLRRKVSRKMKKETKVLYKKRIDRKFLIGRTYTLYEIYIKENPNTEVVQMDTVYNDVTNGPFMQTFKFIKYGFMFIVFHKEKNVLDMLEGVELLYSILGDELFKKYVQVILTDRGTEFSHPEEIEKTSDGLERCKVFYCDPMASHQKGSLENNHELIRYICPKEKDLYSLGLTSQEACNEVTSNIASYGLEILNNKTPFQYMNFLVPDLAKAFTKFGIREIPSDNVVLTPALLASFKKN